MNVVNIESQTFAPVLPENAHFVLKNKLFSSK